MYDDYDPVQKMYVTMIIAVPSLFLLVYLSVKLGEWSARL